MKNLPLIVCLLAPCASQALDLSAPPVLQQAEAKPPDVDDYEIPTFTGTKTDHLRKLPPLKAKKKLDVDGIFNTINHCYPLKSGFGLDVNLRGGLNYRPTTANTQTIQTYDSASYYAGIVASMPLYSDIEIDKERKIEYQRREQTAATIDKLTSAVSAKRRAERLIDLYTQLESRSQLRISEGVAQVDEQIQLLEKLANAQGDLDNAESQIESARLALIGQCRSETVDAVNNYILQEVSQ